MTKIILQNTLEIKSRVNVWSSNINQQRIEATNTQSNFSSTPIYLSVFLAKVH